ncbi:hypothetical protein HUA74_34190 [Myxococcus sp. CA051A]|uniref:Lipoprotein n=1 Tax=Myxococcus llanfairpwllgwyngyllgogerychwyrndrobwllllantysiliogogogochensis TaxID=2590453 RepID=A0A540WW31_9BACT|nr:MULTISPECIES: hypothetical protein [Myxococcus]NTX03398.1 hypothetical protein [Myxococcus sp. CA040A]NTX65724.1 hypothetical protein [Myxococcus sp. CA051A]TQF13228.1 hypothetical protein FJV41_24835 [Myxococcus llanfairpwllgwyngyllgogerychwyrndrobwllllantysiliogogogochensis]
MKALSFIVVAGLAVGMLTGCGPETSSPEAVSGELGPRYEATRADGTPVTVRDASGENNLSAQSIEGERTLTQAACWVTLQWCSEPGTGDIVCTQNGGCTTAQFIAACISLAEDICGI